LTAVLFVTESFHPVLGGGEQHIRRLGRALVERGDAVTVLTRRGEPGWPEAETLDGVRVRRVAPAGPARRGKYLMVAPAMLALARESRYCDLVVVRGTRILGLPTLLAARLLGRPVVMQAEVNGELSGEVYTWGTPLAGGWLERVVRLGVAVRNVWLCDADAFVAMSREIEAEVLEAGVPRHKVALIPHGVDTRRFTPLDPGERAALRSRLGLPPGALLIAYTGRLLRGKGLETLLDAFAGVASRHPAAHLLLVGSGEGQSLSNEPLLRERSAGPGLAGRVSFLGRKDDVAPYLRACDVAVLPSEFEALGLALIEAAACGLPCVGSRTGGIVDVIDDGVTGLLAEPGDPVGLAEALAALAADPERRAAMGVAARARVLERFDLEDSVGRYRCLFREVAARGREAIA
jgi:glycosyltransferase involved in cell wall biosynthesis